MMPLAPCKVRQQDNHEPLSQEPGIAYRHMGRLLSWHQKHDSSLSPRPMRDALLESWLCVRLSVAPVAQVTGRALECQFFGKPNRAPYELAEQLLYKQAVELGLADSQQASTEEPARAFGAIYAIGDNPRADIAGASAQGRPWVSVLVRTGVFSGDAKNDEEYPADVVVDDVLDAVEAALHRTRSMRWHSMR